MKLAGDAVMLGEGPSLSLSLSLSVRTMVRGWSESDRRLVDHVVALSLSLRISIRKLGLHFFTN